MSQSKKNRKGRPQGLPSQGKRDVNSSQVAADVEAAIQPVVTEAGLFLERVKVGRTGGRAVVKVIVDIPWGPGGVDSDALTDVSRAISHLLDDADLVKGAYTLEVSTPGAERLLTEARHFSRAVGRLLSVRFTTGEVLTARLIEAKGDTLSMRTENGVRSVLLSEIASARIRVELGKAEEFAFDEA